MQPSSFCGVVSARVGIEGAVQGIREARSVRLCQLGNYRLELQAQSFSACADDFGILLDGRICNSRELAAQLDAGPLSEPELLLRAYRRWGAGFPGYLEGEFVFALWDQAAARLLLGCGPEGSFALFYAQHGESFFFARDLRDLLAAAGTTPRINENYLARWLSLTHVGSDSTFFENVYRMIPGSVLSFEQGRIARDVYWHPEKISPLHLKDSREYADGLRDVLTQAIRDHLPARADAGALLSGGLDSSTVTSLAAEILNNENRRLHAFTAVPVHPEADLAGRFCDEGQAAASVAAMWPNVDHVLVRHGRHSVFALMDLFSAELMEPIFNPANYDWIYESSLQARQLKLDTLLVGTLGNISISYNGRLALCLLASERRFMAMTRLARDMRHYGSRRWPGIVYEALTPWIPLELRGLINRTRGNTRGLFDYSMIRREFAHRHGLDSMALDRNNERSPSALRILHLRRPEVGAVYDAFRRLTGISRLDPTADRKVIEFCLSVPVEYYCEKGVPRSLIRNAMVGRLPEQVRTEQRRGLQAADFPIHFEKQREEALAELARMKKADLAARTLDLEKLEQMMQWSGEQIAADGGMRCYWPKLLRGFSVGHFLRRFEDGTLFSF